MDKYIGFDVDDKTAIACVLGKVVLTWQERRASGGQLHLRFEVSGSANG